MTMIAPELCKCGLRMETRRVSPAVAGARTVDVSLCVECDRRRCKECESYVQSLTAAKCPLGHVL